MGCKKCDSGWYRVEQCPQSYLGQELIEDINTVDACANGVLPVSGGLMNQSVYYFELSNRLKTERNKIEREQAERRRKHG
jgi:hypothetical protein